ncbi:glycosyltransferase [Paenibacillus dakarensis]|uniref:glycosyltransferase n=1 Tax=Paenibacillus dakarensis TaxID=1527293 RepID=UPI0006D585C8|nr:glycosyltransferase [Paenibacillus dakarensis]
MDKSISLCMIVRNEEDYLERCLESVKDKVNQIVIIDTGSTDSTIEIAQEYTNEIYSFEWCDDFAAARNESLKYAKSDYILVLDADEYLEENADLQEELSSGYDYYFINIHNILSYGRAINHTAIRLFANFKGFLYRNRLHEHLNTMDEGMKYTSGYGNFIINHSGYMEDMMNNRAKNQRNLPLMLQEVKENPTAYNLFNMGRTYMAIGEHEKAIEYLKKSYPLSKQLVIVPELISTLCFCLNELKRYEEALQILRDAVELYPDTTDLRYLQGSIYFEAGYVKDAETSFLECLRLGDQGVTVTEGNGSYMAHYRLAEIYETNYQISKSYEHIIEALKIKKTFAAAIKKYFQLVTKANIPVDDVYQNIELIYRTSNIEELKLLLEVLYSLRHSLLNKYLSEFNIRVEDNVSAVGAQYERSYDKARDQWLSMKEVPKQNGEDILLLSILMRDSDLYQKALPLLNLSKKESRTINCIVQVEEIRDGQLNTSLEQMLERLIIRLLALQEYEVFQRILEYVWKGSLDVKIRVSGILADYGFYEVSIDLLIKLFELYPNDKRIITLLGDICFYMNYLEDAQLFYTKLLDQSPEYSTYERCYDLFHKLNEGESAQNIKFVMKNLYPLSNWANPQNSSSQDIYETQEVLAEAKSMVTNHENTHLEIAFMPYKASMWDSLESIYREAEKDPDCSCYVVPIPYYEKNAQGEIIKFCYEGNEFPDDINITPFEIYDFEDRRPDIIYIHNPYDKYNTLTMVNPRFFSDNLAKYTDMLVYVPYYVAGSSDVPYVLVTPAFENVTKIVTQSKSTKDAYIEAGLNANKLLDIGSPKVDAMLTAVNEGREISPYWRFITQNKKVFLFNTGIADLLSFETWFEQLEQIINYFMNHSRYALIWRPHPLTDITIKTMRPHLLERFEILKNKLKQAVNIIIDLNSDIYPAVTISDGIISDYSSVMLQCIITGKPVLGLLSEKMTREDRYYYADYLGCYFIDQDMSLNEFTAMVENHEDYKKVERMNKFIKSMSNPDGSCGQKIHHNIKNEVVRGENSCITLTQI